MYNHILFISLPEKSLLPIEYFTQDVFCKKYQNYLRNQFCEKIFEFLMKFTYGQIFCQKLLIADEILPTEFKNEILLINFSKGKTFR